MSQGFFRTTAIIPGDGRDPGHRPEPHECAVGPLHAVRAARWRAVGCEDREPRYRGCANPVPALASMTPTSATAGSPPLTLTVNGSNFVATSKVRWNGAERTTTFVSGTELRAAIPAADIAAAGTAQVTVASPAPGGGVSGALPFTVSTGTGSNPVPSVTGVAPGTVTAGGPAFTLTVTGSNFVNASRVRWNGVDRTTTVVSATQLTAAIPAGDIVAGGAAQVTVFNPSPGGGTSPARGRRGGRGRQPGWHADRPRHRPDRRRRTEPRRHPRRHPPAGGQRRLRNAIRHLRRPEHRGRGLDRLPVRQQPNLPPRALPGGQELRRRRVVHHPARAGPPRW